MKKQIVGLYELIYSPILTTVTSLLLRKLYVLHNANKMKCPVFPSLHRTFHCISCISYNEPEMYWPINSFAHLSKANISSYLSDPSLIKNKLQFAAACGPCWPHSQCGSILQQWELVNINLPAKYSNSKEKLGPLLLTEINWGLGWALSTAR